MNRVYEDAATSSRSEGIPLRDLFHNVMARSGNQETETQPLLSHRRYCTKKKVAFIALVALGLVVTGVAAYVLYWFLSKHDNNASTIFTTIPPTSNPSTFFPTTMDPRCKRIPPCCPEGQMDMRSVSG